LSVALMTDSLYWWMSTPPALAVARYALKDANVLARFVGQHETSNQGARSPDEARRLTSSDAGAADGVR
jgi:hypothetical protein